ncbi:hypothetical protein GCA01S_084_00060 [Parageobacillus caldoxylosilyticus NBRC 107762]|uniref:Uncharacterized protein n=1 Tax=Parageobacillus caldoxylosilyticus NBRC 107762 TaxID=1220594 RepID=A0A023DK93_9BACL|nr:hypothetical protein GCA01S_084_00060 [Parageobacillus caldoxylosilyticus NBRC 107762]
MIEDSGKKADYIVVGDCDHLNGIIAPYDEENTKYISKSKSWTTLKTCLISGASMPTLINTLINK